MTDNSSQRDPPLSQGSAVMGAAKPPGDDAVHQQPRKSSVDITFTHPPAELSSPSQKEETDSFTRDASTIPVHGGRSARLVEPHATLPTYASTKEDEGSSADASEPPHAPYAESPLLFSAAAQDPPPPPSRTPTNMPQPSHRGTTPAEEREGSGALADATSVQKAAPPAPPQLPMLPPDEASPEYIEFYDDPDDDGYGVRSLLEAVTNPQLLLRTQYSLRTVALVTFPLYTIALHPNTRYRLGFPQMLIASVVSTSTHRPTLGEQIGLHSWTWRGIIFMLIWGTVVDAWGIANHVGAWYGLLAAGIFSAGLVNNGMMRRFVYLYFFLYMLELRTHQHYFGVVLASDAAYSAMDYLIGSLMGVAANIFPFPSLVRDAVDVILAKIFGGFGKLLLGMVNYTWSADIHASAFFYDDRTPFISIEGVLSHMSALLWFTSWEPMEFPLRNPIRRVKLSLLRRMMALAYAAFSCGRTIATFRQQHADKEAMHKIRCHLYEAAHGKPLRVLGSRGDAAATSPHTGDHIPRSRSGDKDGSASAAEQVTTQASMEELRANTHTYVKDFAMTLMQVTALIGSTESTPEQLLKKVPFDALREKDTAMRRNLRLEILQVMKMESDLVARRRAREQQACAAAATDEAQEEDADDDHDSESSSSGSSDENAESNVPYGARGRYRHRRADARLLLEHRDVIDSFAIFLRINQIFFHLLLSMLAGELLNFGEQMQDYKPAAPLLCRWWRHYIVEAWDGFWSELWCRLTLARPTDYRTVKDALRMTCAYLVATALNIELWNPVNGLYFFGVTPLLGLPVEEESLGIGLCRIGGNTLGCALGYLAYHNTTNFAQQIAMVLCLTFIQQVCKYHAQYGQFFFYGSVITLAGLATSMVFNELLTRLVTSSYTVMAYLMCCLFLFPNDCRKICFNYRCKLTKAMSEAIDDVALTARLPIEYTAEADGGADGNEPVAYPTRNTDAMQMCSQLNIELTLVERLLGMCDKWTPFAAGELVIRGMSQFPAGPNTLLTYGHNRMVANLRLLVFGMQLLHRPRTVAPAPGIARLLRTTLAEFLDDFADAVRLVGMDHVTALQRSRTWSYPQHLQRVGQMRRLRVRVHALMYECYVLVANHVSKGTFGMTALDFEEMRRDEDGGGMRRTTADGAAAYHHVGHVHSDLSFLPGAGGNPLDGMVSPPAPAATAAKATRRAAQQSPPPMPADNRIDVSAGEEAAAANMSFVDRYLVARREEEESEEAATARSHLSRRSSRLAKASREEGEMEGNGQRDEREELPPQSQRQHPHSPAFSTPANNNDNNSFGRASSAVDASLRASASFAGRRRAAPYAHRAHLQQSAAEPKDAWPLTIDSAERDVAQLLTAKAREEGAARGADRTEVGEKSVSEGGSGKASFAPVAPTKANRHVSQLILFPDKGPEMYIPLYDGPRFTYVEDELDMPADTDFNAITTILLSCESTMAEFEAMPGALNTMSSYDKQLQESSVATAFLDKWGTRLKDYRKGIHDRYHYPKPPPQKRRPMHAQEDPFEDWKF